jgi:hypothetical protein
MNQVQVGQNTFQMPPQDGFSVARFITVTDVGRSARFTKRSSEAVLAASVGSFFRSESVAIVKVFRCRPLRGVVIFSGGRRRKTSKGGNRDVRTAAE